MQAAYDMLNDVNKSFIDNQIELLLKEQMNVNQDTIDAIKEAESGNAPYKFDNMDDLSRWLHEEC